MAYRAVYLAQGSYSRAVPLVVVSLIHQKEMTLLMTRDILCTAGGDISMTLTDEFRSCSRIQRTNAFKAALEAE